MKKRVFITGITGFVGTHLARELCNRPDTEVAGSFLEEHSKERLSSLADRIRLYQLDIRDSSAWKRTLEESRPDWVFHLATQSNVAESWKHPAETFDANVLGTIHLLETIRQLGLNPTIQLACSSEQYGLAETLPVTETSPFNPLSPYAVSRVSIDLLGYQYFKSYGLKTIRTRAFNHTGPGQEPNYVCPSFAKQIAEIEAGIRPPVLTVGNLDAVRDFTDVRDMTRAYTLAVEKGEPGAAYIICSGVGRSIQEVLETFLSLAQTKIQIQHDQQLMRPSDVPALFGDASQFSAATGWKPTIPFQQTVADLLDEWRGRVKTKKDI